MISTVKTIIYNMIINFKQILLLFILITIVSSHSHFVATDYLNAFAKKLKECRLKSFEIVEVYRKTDVSCFTQGLIFDRKEVTLEDGSTEE